MNRSCQTCMYRGNAGTAATCEHDFWGAKPGPRAIEGRCREWFWKGYPDMTPEELEAAPKHPAAPISAVRLARARPPHGRNR
jgi:hypothetical protein